MAGEVRAISAFVIEQGSQSAEGLPNKPAPARLVFSAASETEVVDRRELITRVTKDHEIVDVDGFVFKRKRRTPLTDSINLPAAQVKRAKPSADLEAAPGREAEGVCATGQQMAMHKDAAAMAEAALKSLPSEGASEASRLMILCRKCVQDAVEGAEGSLGATQLQAMLEDFLAAVEASLENGTLQAAEAVPAHVAALREQRALLATLHSEQDVLQKRLERFEQEEQEWLQLLKETEDPVSGACAEAIPAAAALDDAGADGSGAAQGVAGTEPGGSTDLCDLSGSGKTVDVASEQSALLTDTLRQAHIDTHRTLSFQVDGLCAMVEGVQDLVAKADQISAQEFDTLYKKKFSALPGLNSPARLIREFVKPDSIVPGAPGAGSLSEGQKEEKSSRVPQSKPYQG